VIPDGASSVRSDGAATAPGNSEIAPLTGHGADMPNSTRMSGSRTPIQSKLSIWRVKGCRTDFYNPMKLRMLAFISHRTKLWLIWSSTLTVAFGLMFVVYERAPPNTFDPFCTYRLAYRLNVTIEIGEKQ
jgi:hypothetical protein